MTAPREMLRRQLEQADPDLHRALMRNWETAWEEWLPALGNKSDSYNSYPHIRNVEHHLDNLLMVEEGSPASSRRVQFRPVEVYVLLAAALFHDIGLTKTGKDEEGHAEKSSELVQTHHASFGVPSNELANIIGQVCEAHHSELGPNDPKLTTLVVEPYGEVRRRSLATLLFVADHMDSAFRRVLPEYIRSEGEIDVVGAFRRVIRGVEVDHGSKMIRTVLGALDDVKERQADLAYYVEPVPDKKGKKKRKKKNRKEGIKWISKSRAISKAAKRLRRGPTIRKVTSGFLKDLNAVSSPLGDPLTPGPDFAALARRVPLLVEMGLRAKDARFDVADWFIARGIMRVGRSDLRDSKPKVASWPRCKILAAILRDFLRNATALAGIRDNLAAVGIPIRAWVLEGNERLFNHWGEQTYEPIFSKDYLERVAGAMWDLSTHVFGRSLFTYRNLADAIHDPDVEKVRTAAQRIARVTRAMKETGCDWRGAVWAGETHWRWNAGSLPGPRGGRMSRWCRSVHLRRVVETMRRLGEPI